MMCRLCRLLILKLNFENPTRSEILFAAPPWQEGGDPIVPRDNPEFLAMEADLKDRKRKQFDKAKTAEKCHQRGNQSMTEGGFKELTKDFVNVSSVSAVKDEKVKFRAIGFEWIS